MASDSVLNSGLINCVQCFRCNQSFQHFFRNHSLKLTHAYHLITTAIFKARNVTSSFRNDSLNLPLYTLLAHQVARRTPQHPVDWILANAAFTFKKRSFFFRFFNGFFFFFFLFFLLSLFVPFITKLI